MSKLIKSSGKSHLVKDYLIHSYLYYEINVNLIEDHEFDAICKELLVEYDNNEHMHKHLVHEGNLTGNTGYGINYPLIVQHSAIELFKTRTGKYPADFNK